MSIKLVDELFADYAEMSGFILSHFIPEDRVKTVIGDILESSHFYVYCNTTGEEWELPITYHPLFDPDKVYALLQGRITEFSHYDKMVSLKIKSDVE